MSEADLPKCDPAWGSEREPCELSQTFDVDGPERICVNCGHRFRPVNLIFPQTDT